MRLINNSTYFGREIATPPIDSNRPVCLGECHRNPSVYLQFFNAGSSRDDVCSTAYELYTDARAIREAIQHVAAIRCVRGTLPIVLIDTQGEYV